MKEFGSRELTIKKLEHDLDIARDLAQTWRKESEYYEWVDTSEGRRADADRKWKNCVGWFWSWGGLDVMHCPHSYVGGKDLLGKTPRQVIKEIVG